MSLPQELLDQLLSGYLDDTLSTDERQSVERLLQTEPAVGEQLEQLREMRQSLRLLAQCDSVVKLDRGFADRVLGAAVAKAQEAGLAEDHPLIRLAEQRSTNPEPVSDRKLKPWWKAAAVVAGIAASIGFAVMVIRPWANTLSTNTPSDLVAQSGIGESPSISLDPADVPLPDSGRGNEVVDVVESPGPMLVEAPSGLPTEIDSQPQSPTNSIAMAPGDRPTDIPQADAPQTDVPQADLGAAVGLLNGGAMMVLEVRRTESGRNIDAVAKAMRAAEMTPASRKEVSDQVAGFVADELESQESASSEDVKVLYLQVPARQFDVFYRVLWNDQEGVESLMLSVATNAPVMQIVDLVQRDPRLVQHEPAAFELFSRDGAVNGLIRELNELPFAAADRRKAPTGLFGSGADITAQVLVLVR